jgi:hypothetical protein
VPLLTVTLLRVTTTHRRSKERRCSVLGAVCRHYSLVDRVGRLCAYESGGEIMCGN